MNRLFNVIPTFDDKMLDGLRLKMTVVKREGVTMVAGQDVSTGVIYVIKCVTEN